MRRPAARLEIDAEDGIVWGRRHAKAYLGLLLMAYQLLVTLGRSDKMDSQVNRQPNWPSSQLAEMQSSLLP